MNCFEAFEIWMDSGRNAVGGGGLPEILLKSFTMI